MTETQKIEILKKCFEDVVWMAVTHNGRVLLKAGKYNYFSSTAKCTNDDKRTNK